jgi:hypothetical protein
MGSDQFAGRPQTNGSAVSESPLAIGGLTEENRGRISSGGGNRGQEGGQEAENLTLQFLTVVQKHYIKSISRMEGVVVERNSPIAEENGITKKDYKMEAAPSERFQQGDKRFLEQLIGFREMDIGQCRAGANK